MPAASKYVTASKDKYPAYPNCRPTAQYLITGSKLLESAAIAAALKCSTFLPTRINLLLDGIERSDLPGRTVRAVKIPGVEAREVLDCSEELVTAHCRGYVLEVVSHRGVVDEGVGDHLGGVVYIL